jgi:outer membrane protein TolC
MLTRDQMVAIIQRGESVMIGSEVYDSMDRLPSEAQLAQGDPAREEAALANLDAQLAAVQAQRELILRSQLARQGAPAGAEGQPPAPPPQVAPAPPPPEEREEQVVRRDVGVPRRAK